MISMIIMIKIIGLNYLIMLIKRLSATVFRSYYKNYFISKNKWDLIFVEEVGPYTLLFDRSSSLATHPEGNIGTWTVG